jgi:hypothetical protein
MDLTIEDNSFAAPGRRTAIGVGGTLFMLSSAFAAAVAAGFLQGNAGLVGPYFAIGLPDFGILAVLMALARVSTVTLWRWYVTGSGVAIILWPAGLVIQWFRGFEAGDPVSNLLNGMTWYALLGCALLGGLLIVIAKVAGRRPPSRSSYARGRRHHSAATLDRRRYGVRQDTVQT